MNNIADEVLGNAEKYIETFYQIKSKSKEIVPFILNPIQRDYIRSSGREKKITGRGERDLSLKARQHGFTTIKAAQYLHDSSTNYGVFSAIVGHEEDAMEKLLDNVKLMFYSVPEEDRPEVKYDNKEELFFPKLNSGIYITTYRKLKLRSQTVNNILMTEVAFWKSKNVGDLVAGMTESVPMDGNICIESTPKGVGGYFWQMVQNVKKGLSTYKLYVYPWFVNPEYRIPMSQWKFLPEQIRPRGNDYLLDKNEISLIKRWELDLEQIMWRRYKMMSMGDMTVSSKGIRTSRRFSQEYECSFTQSGLPVFDSTYLVPETHFQEPKKNGKYIHGGDTSEGVEDGNYNVLYTIDLATGEAVNKIRGLWKPREFAQRCHAIGMKYGGLMGIESNNTGHAVLVKLADFFEEDATRLQEEADQKYEDAKKSRSGEAIIKALGIEADRSKYERMPYRIYSEKKRLGWNTGELNRKLMFIEGEEALRKGDLKLAEEDEQGIEELMACQYNDKMKEKAPEGMYDDSIMSLLIAWQMRKYFVFYFKEGKGGGVNVISH